MTWQSWKMRTRVNRVTTNLSMIIVLLLDDENIWRLNGSNFCLINNNIDLKQINCDKSFLKKFLKIILSSINGS